MRIVRCGRGFNLFGSNSPPLGAGQFIVGHLTSALLSRNSRIDAARDFAPVSQIASGTLMLVMHAAVPARTLKEFIAYARSKPGQIKRTDQGRDCGRAAFEEH